MDEHQAREMDEALWAIFDLHRDELRGQVADIEAAVASVLDGTFDVEVAELATRQAHRLSGSGGMFGLHRTTQISRELEVAFGHPRPDDGAWVTRVSELAVSLGTMIESEVEESHGGTRGAPTEPAPGDDVAGPLVALALDDESLTRAVVSTARGRGLRVTGWEPDQRDPSRRPDVAVVQAATHEGTLDELLSPVDDASSPVLVLVVTRPGERVDRVELARLGVRGFLSEPIEATHVVAAVEDLLDEERLRGVTIVAVDDDPAVLAVLDELLTDEGVTVETVQDPGEVWDVLERVDPDLLLLDVEMPGTDGIELCRIVRRDHRFDHVSICFLTSHTDHDTVTAVFEAGADDYVAKPLNRHELVVRITNRLDRIHLLRAVDDVDRLTGVASARRARWAFQRLSTQAADWRQPLSVVVVDLDGLRAVNDQHGRAVGDELLVGTGKTLLEAFTAPSVVARWGGQEFLVLMPGMSRPDALDRVARVVEARRDAQPTSVGPVHTTMSAGVALYGPGEDGQDLHELSLAAERAVRTAKGRGGDRVVAAGAQDSATHTHDVAIVEDDPTLSAVLEHAMRTRGWRTVGIADGDRAAGLLAGPDPQVRARVVVLDWDLPGIDGPTVLRRMVDGNHLDRTGVIMLTAHAQEEEVLRTLELGAVDHVGKPFSVPVLMQRIRHAMGS